MRNIDNYKLAAMISDPKSLADVRQLWESVRKIQRGLQRDFFAEGVQISTEVPKEAYNLPLVLAYAVLDRVLTELLYQGVYTSKGWDPSKGRPPMLGKKMAASKTNLSWKDYDLVHEGKGKRNDLAHEAALVEKTECLNYIEAIEDELKAWNLLS